MPSHWSLWDIQVSGPEPNQQCTGLALTKTTNLIGRCETCRHVQHTPPSYNEQSVEACYLSHIYGTDIGNIDGNPM